jgi:multidrug efflux pump subunit AcrA (membrane-fusion protein)
VTLPNPRNQLRAGMIASLALEDEQKRPGLALLIPLSAIVRPPGSSEGYSVFVISGGGADTSAHLHPVELGRMYGNRVLAISGVRAGEQVVTTGATMLHDNQAVQVVP